MQVEEVELTDIGRSMPFDEIIGSFLHYTDDNNATFQALQAHFAQKESFAPVQKIPFSSDRKWSAIAFEEFTFIIGAPERLAGPELGDHFEKELNAGKRILLAGITPEPVSPDKPLPEIHVLVSIVISDPIRPNAAETLAYFQQEGVDLKLISGDNPVTVSALAAKAGFPDADRYIDMSGVTEEADLEKAVQEYSIFGRVSPLQKKQIVQSLQKHGHSVAMTGDGVNDLLALREADCSIAIAEGSDAARQVSQVVLLNSDFSSLPSVLSEGRRVVNNITRVAGIFFVKTIYSVLLSIVCLLLNIPFPFVPIQITLIDLVIEGYPSFFMSFEPDSRKVSGRFLPSVMARALPNAISILVCFLVFLGVSPLLQISVEQSSILLYLLVGTVGIQAVFKASWPLNKLRVFLCSTMTVGFYAAVLLFHKLLQVSLPTTETLLLFAGFALLSFLIERGATALIQWIHRRRDAHKRATNTAR